jgi:glycolate oxidase iron-sulfur subunit
MELKPDALAQIDSCVHCGLCLPACPTYRELGNEADSPRGRIHLIRALHTGTLEPGAEVLTHLDLCLDCRACETACPSGVKYGTIIEGAREALAPIRARPAVPGLLRWALRSIVARPRRLRAAARLARGLQKLKLARVLLPGPAAALAEVAQVSATFGRDLLPEVVPAQGERRWRVGFLTGCVMDVLFGPTNLASVRVLAANGCEVVIPRSQGCCGALHAHSGDAETARALARRNIDTFLAAGVDYMIINAAGCGSSLKEYGRLLADDPAYADKARRFAALVRDISEFLGAIDLVPPSKALPLRVTYQDACHLAHGQGVRLQPRKVLAQIPGIQLVEHPDSDACCGSAGIYNLVQPELSSALLERKMDTLARSGAPIVVSANPGCMLQLKVGARRRGLDLEVLHVIDLLDRAYGGE